uniref:Uncharacterized protein n=1 Tax=Arundo donax TaxID=35708 RepID=A0A0A9HYC7_ARUDO
MLIPIIALDIRQMGQFETQWVSHLNRPLPQCNRSKINILNQW